MQAKKSTRDLYVEVTQRIVAALEQGVRPWSCPWQQNQGRQAGRPTRHNGEAYRGVNVLLLWATAQERGFQANTWLTYKQAEALGAQVRRGERGTMVVYAGKQMPAARDEDADGQAREQGKAFSFLRSYTVFNVEQVDGLPVVEVPPGPVQPLVTPDQKTEAFFSATGARFVHGGGRAFYSPSTDHIQLPEPSAFKDAAAYTATKAHELAHWTGHSQRLAREFGRRFGDAAYAVEELVAELCAAFICAELQIGAEPREDHASYLAAWLQVLKADSRAIFTAAAQAQQAADYLCQLQRSQA